MIPQIMQIAEEKMRKNPLKEEPVSYLGRWISWDRKELTRTSYKHNFNMFEATQNTLETI